MFERQTGRSRKIVCCMLELNGTLDPIARYSKDSDL